VCWVWGSGFRVSDRDCVAGTLHIVVFENLKWSFRDEG